MESIIEQSQAPARPGHDQRDRTPLNCVVPEIFPSTFDPVSVVPAVHLFAMSNTRSTYLLRLLREFGLFKFLSTPFPALGAWTVAHKGRVPKVLFILCRRQGTTKGRAPQVLLILCRRQGANRGRVPEVLLILCRRHETTKGRVSHMLLILCRRQEKLQGEHPTCSL